MTITANSIDLREKGRGEQYSNARMYVQFYAFGNCRDTAALMHAVAALDADAVLYADVNDFRGVGLAVFHREPDYFVTGLRNALAAEPFASLRLKEDLTMFGRSYTLGHEQDLQEALVDRPLGRALNPVFKWAVWYPVQRVKEFELLEPQERRKILMEHAELGKLFGKEGIAQDIRLLSYGLDKNDNDFLIGLVGPELHGLSAIVQAMRKTEHTARYLDNLGPFFIGRVLLQSAR